MKGNYAVKFFFFMLVISSTLIYAYTVRRRFVDLENYKPTPILKEIPRIQFPDLLNKKTVQFISESNAGKRKIVHFWGTWCGPCETELPSFISFAKKFENKKVQFFLVAVNDEKAKVKKFLSRFKTFPKNLKISLDNSGVLMESFGVVKVPETFVFNEKGKTLKKFSGPQEWNFPYYSDFLEKKSQD
jgi:thiol-disulfide isomerase/thioredoxin